MLFRSFIGEQEQIAPLFSAKSVDGVRAYEIARKLWKKQAMSESAGRTEETKTFDKAAETIIRAAKIRIEELELMEFIPGDVKKSSHMISSSDSTCYSNDTYKGKINVTDNSSLLLTEAKIRIVCSKGTYVRAFARDLGEVLDSGAHLSSLIRSRSGYFKVEDCMEITQATEALF